VIDDHGVLLEPTRLNSPGINVLVDLYIGARENPLRLFCDAGNRMSIKKMLKEIRDAIRARIAALAASLAVMQTA
jgi:hypothetical protein